MVQGQRSAKQVVKAMRVHARRQGYTVRQLSRRGKGSHTLWGVFDAAGTELGRIGLTGHAGAMSPTVTRSNELALEPIFGKGWLDE